MPDGVRIPYERHAGDRPAVNWSAELERLHAQSSREHFIDVWTRAAILERLGAAGVRRDARRPGLLDRPPARGPAPGAARGAPGRGRPDRLGAAQGAPAGPRRAPAAGRRVRAAARRRERGRGGEREPARARARRRAPRWRSCGGCCAPARAPCWSFRRPAATYDYYDRFLGHERRYARGELAAQGPRGRPGGARGRAPGKPPVSGRSGSSSSATGAATASSRARRSKRASPATSRARATRASGRLACALERGLLRRGVRLPFGIRGLTVVRRRGAGR